MMTNEMIVRAWKDPKFREELGDTMVPANPVGDAAPKIEQFAADAYITAPSICTANPICTLCSLCG